MESDSRSQYSYLSEDDLNEYKSDPEQLKNLNEFRKKDLEKKIANLSLSENKFNDKIPPHSTVEGEVKLSLSENRFNDEKPPYSAATDDLRLVIIGKTGQGKSATANTILGKVRFEEDFTATSVTRESRCVTELVDGRKISVMDTPGLQDTHKSNKSILKELARMTKLFPDGVHAFVYVMNMADPRFTAEDQNVLDLIEKTFGGGFKNYCVLVYSHGDSELKKINLDTYIKRQMAIGQETPQSSRKDQRGEDQDRKGLANFLQELSWRILAIDNKTSIPFEKAHYRAQIVAMVDRMRTWNRPEIYTNKIFVKAQQEREAMRQKGLRKGWSPSIMSKVETILAANPSISREELQAEVIRQLQEEEEERLQKEERERQREEREWKLGQERQEFERQRRLDREDIDMQRWQLLYQRQQDMWKGQVRGIAEEHKSSLEKVISTIVSIAEKVVGWIF